MANHTHIRPLRDLLERPVRRLDLPPPFSTGSASALDFHHPDPALTLLRRRMPVECGDYSFELVQHPRSPDHTFLDFVSCHILDQCSSRPELGLHSGAGITPAHIAHLWDDDLLRPEWTYPCQWMDDVEFPSPAHVLWQTSSFGLLQWRSRKVRWLREALERVAQGGEVGRWPYHRDEIIWVETSPTLSAAEVPALRDLALDRLIALTERRRRAYAWQELPDPNPPIAAGSELFDHIAHAIEEDCTALAELCRTHGTYGQAVFPDLRDPTARCEQMMVPLLDGNTRDVFLETEDAWVSICFETS